MIKRRVVSFIAVCLAVIMLLGGCSAGSIFKKASEKEEAGAAEKTKVKKGTVKYENGDHLYIPGEDEMVLDKEAYVIFYKNLLSVYTFETLTEKQIKALCKEVDGELAGQISGAINMLQLKVDAEDYDTLAELSEKLMELPEVMYATYEYPMEISENTPEDEYEDTNPWKNGKKKNDWWATAIHARGAWELSDIKEDIRVGVIDSGFDTDHDDLGTLHFLPSYPDNTESDHGTHVAGLIAAQDNEIGIRGVADTAELYCVDWSPYTNDEKDENYVNYINSHEYTEIIDQLVEDYDVKVINNSWGFNLYSEKAFKEKLYGKQSLVVWLLDDLINDASDVYNKALYDEYLKALENEASKSSEECLELMVQLLLNDKDVLIVQAAGNGYDNGGSGYDASRIGDFCGITQETFDSLSLNTKNKLAAKGISLKNIREHIIVVGAYENTTDDNGNYKMCSFSNFGATVDICAPGQDILSTVCDDAYANDTGTSMAAPIISGCAALLWQNSPELTAGEIKKLLVESTDVKAVGVTGSDSGKLYPTVNIENAILSLGLRYEMREEYIEHKTSEGIVLRTNTVKYPYFFGNSELEKTLNKKYADQIKKCKEDSVKDNDKEYSFWEKDPKGSSVLPLYGNIDVTVSYNKNGYFSFTEHSVDWQGGAHPYHYKISYIYDTKTAEEKEYRDFMNGTDAEIKTFLTGELKKVGSGNSYKYSQVFEIDNNASLTEDGIFFFAFVGSFIPDVCTIPYTDDSKPEIDVSANRGKFSYPGEIPVTEEELADLFTEANVFFVGWLSNGFAAELDNTDTIKKNGFDYARIVSDEFGSVDDLLAEAAKYFDEELYKDRIDSYYTMDNGKLYGIVELGQGGDVSADGITLAVTDADKDFCEFTATFVYASGDSYTQNYRIEKINGKWLFTGDFIDDLTLYDNKNFVISFG